MLHSQIFRQPPGKGNKANRGRKETEQKGMRQKKRILKAKSNPENCVVNSHSQQNVGRKNQRKASTIEVSSWADGHFDGQTDRGTLTASAVH